MSPTVVVQQDKEAMKKKDVIPIGTNIMPLIKEAENEDKD